MLDILIHVMNSPCLPGDGFGDGARKDPLLSLSGTVLWEADAGWRLLSVSDGVESLLGYTAEELVGAKEISELVPAGERAKAAACLKAVARGERQLEQTEQALVHKNGAVVWVSVSVQTSDAEPVRFRGIVQDINRFKRSQVRLEELSDRLALGQKAGRYGNWDWHVGNGFSFWDDAMMELYQVEFPDHRVPFTFWQSALHPDDRERIDRELAEFMKDSDRLGLSFRITRPDGTVRHLRSSAIIQRDESGEPVRVVGLDRDETEEVLLREGLEREREAAVSANRSKSEFFALMSHEIRTPMNAVLGFCELLERTHLAPEQREYVNEIANGGANLIEIIDSLLDFSKFEAGKFAFRREEIRPVELIQKTFRALESVAARQGIGYRLEIDPEALPDSLVSDPFAIRRILTNLIGNALKFTKNGEVVVRVRSDGGSRSPGIAIDVLDSGIGIDQETLGHLFEPFYQAASPYKRQFGGTGLGLAIARRMAAGLGCELSAKNRDGGGTIFSFVLRGQAGTVPTQEAVGKPEPVVPAGTRVLVVEDQVPNQKLVGLFLKRLGCESVIVSGGREALERLEKEIYDLVFMDIQMPGMDGWETVRELRRRELETGRPRQKVFALSAHAGDEERQRCFESGMDGHVAKPVSLQAVASAIAGAIASD